MAHAKSERVTQVLLDQLQGALSREILVLDRLIGDRDIPTATQKLKELLERVPVGLHLDTPWQIVLAGRPNVGKSSLMNALLGFGRSIVRDQPGTTRDLVSTETAFGGWPVELHDTAGLRTGGDTLEKAGIELSWNSIQHSDHTLLISDASLPWTDKDDELLLRVPASIVVHNKADCSPLCTKGRPPGVFTSAITGLGLAELVKQIETMLVPDPPPPQAGVPFRSEQVQALKDAEHFLTDGRPHGARIALRRLLPRN